jgi:acetyltransferase
MQTSTHDAIEHYPVDLIDVWRAANGAGVLLRPVLPQDEVPLGDMVARASRTSRYRRFHGSIRELSPASLRHMTRVDYRQHMALVVTATGAGAGRVLADARYCVNEAGGAAEFAVLVDDAWQRRGLGIRMIRALGDAATQAGIRWLHGSVLADNVPMLALMHRCGFSIGPDRDEEGLVQVELNLTAGRSSPMSRDGVAWPGNLFKAAGSLISGQFR